MANFIAPKVDMGYTDIRDMGSWTNPLKPDMARLKAYSAEDIHQSPSEPFLQVPDADFWHRHLH